MQTCPTHHTPFHTQCPTCASQYRGVLAASGLVIDRPPHVDDIYDLPDALSPLCEAMIADGGSANSHATCVRPARHEGDCEDLHGLLWDHEDDCGCHDTSDA